MPKFFSIRASHQNLLGQVLVNDVLVDVWDNPESASSAQQINIWVTKGENVVSIRVLWPPGAPFQPGVAAAEVGVVCVDDPRNPSAAARVGSFVWPPTFSPALEAYPGTGSIRFVVLEAPPSDFWPNAQKLHLDEGVRSAVVGRILELHDALSKRDIDKVMELLSFRARDVGGSHGITPSDSLAAQREFLEFATSAADWHMAPLEAQEIALSLVANERLIWCMRLGSQPILRSDHRGRPQLILPVYIGLVNGKWTIVR
jgi:hypothetical protein